MESTGELFVPFPEQLPSWYSCHGAVTGAEAEELERIRCLSRSVTGWLSECQGIALYQIARRPIPGGALEIGSFCGKSTIFIALGCKHSGAPFHAVDPHKSMIEGGKEQYGPDFQPRTHGSFDEFRATLDYAGLVPSVTPVVATSEHARSQLGELPLKLLFIDGSHDYLDVVLDYHLWQELVVGAGYLVLHDSNFATVNRMIHAHLDRRRYAYEGAVGEGGWAMTVWRRRMSTLGQY